MTDIHEVVAAFADGERVDADELDRALAEPAGRAYLIDVLLVRGLVGDQTSPESAFVAAPVRSERRRPFAGGFAIAASLLLLLASGLGGFVAGHRVAGALAPSDPIAAPDPIVMPDTQISAPAPTRVIQVEPGVDWKRQEGN
jgi:hypothetical protein